MRNKLISSVAGVAFSFAVSGVAFAADMAVKMPVRAPPPPPAPVYSWTGWYVGGNVGYGWGRSNADVNYFAPEAAVVPPFVCSFTALCISGSDTVNMNGIIGGVQAGYNWQNGNYLLGVETDFQGSGQRGTRDLTIPSVAPNFISGTAAVSVTERTPWLGTVRGRVGYIANQWLLYATGGLAYGRIEVDSSASATGLQEVGTPTCNGTTCPVWNFSGSGVTKIGWNAGAGAELALGGNWTVKFEYLFVDLGSFDTTFTGLPGCFGNGAGCSNTQAATGTIRKQPQGRYAAGLPTTSCASG